MTQITKTSNDLVIRAAKLCKFYQNDTFGGSQFMSDGLDSLNILLDEFQARSIMIPFVKDLSFNLIVGTSRYNFGYDTTATMADSQTLLSLLYCDLFDENNAIYKIRVTNQFEMNNQALNQESNTLPRICRIQRFPQYTSIIFYPAPDKAYSCTITGKFALQNVARNQTLTGISPYAYKYLTYAVAKEFGLMYPSAEWGSAHESELRKMEKDFIAANDLDLQSRAVNSFNEQYGNYYNGYQ